MSSAERGQRQSAYEILVMPSPDESEAAKALWASGKVLADQSIGIAYGGKVLHSRQDAWWKVRVWDKDSRVSDWSPWAHWSSGLLDASDWQAQWIADAGLATKLSENAARKNALPASLFRKGFPLEGKVRRATAYVTALGLYEFRINGRRVGKELLAPEWTSYSNRVQYQTYDVTGLMQAGSNVVTAQVGEGWYAGRLMVVGFAAYGGLPKFLLQLEVELENGSRLVIASDGSWRSTSEGPIRSSGIYDGESYDARQEQAGWETPGFDDSSWRQAQAFPLDGRQLVWQRNEPILLEQTLECVGLSQPIPGHYVFDLGQNMVGWCQLQGEGTRGQSVTLRHAEATNDDGTIYTANLRGAPEVDSFIPAKDGVFRFEPHFTYHGFRFVEVTGLASPPTLHAVQGCVFHSAAPLTGTFECSDASLNQLMRNIVWTERANLMSSPNDCPQRDERFGWMGDIQAFAQTAMFNMDLAAFSSKFCQDTRDDQASDGRFPDFAPHPGDPNKQFSGVPAWGDAGVFVPWDAFVNYANTQLLRDQFPAARRWVEYIRSLNPELIWSKGRNNDYNDWLNGDTIKQHGWPEKGGAVPNELFATAFFAHSTDLVARMAKALGEREQELHYRALFEAIKRAFNQRFVGADGSLAGETQAGYALALHFDLLPPELRRKAADHLVAGIHQYQGHLSTGIQTTHRAMLELSRWGYEGLAWQLLTNRTFPSWLYMVDNGATTVSERWDGYVRGRGFQDPGMNSLNHWALGAIGEWMWRHVIGLNPDEQAPGWKHFFIRPQPGGGVTWARGEYASVRGPIHVAWKLRATQFELDVSIPANTSATVELPELVQGQIEESGEALSKVKSIRSRRGANGKMFLEVPSGEYHFRCAPSL